MSCGDDDDDTPGGDSPVPAVEREDDLRSFTNIFATYNRVVTTWGLAYANRTKDSIIKFGEQVSRLGSAEVEKNQKEANIHSDLSQYCWAGEDNYVYMFSKLWAVRLSDGAYDWSDISVKKDYKRYNAVCYFFNENGEVW